MNPDPALIQALSDLRLAYLATVRVMLDGEARRRGITPAVDVHRFPVVLAATEALRRAGV